MDQQSNYGVEAAFKNATLSKENFIKQFLKNYVDEDYAWMSKVLMIDQGFDNEMIRQEYTKFANLNDIKDYTLRRLRYTENVNKSLEKISNAKEFFFPSSHLDIIRGDIKKILIAANLLLLEFLSSTNITLYRFNSINNRNNDQYLFLLFILYYEISDNDIQKAIQIINEVPRQLEEISNYKVNLNKYIDDINFIEWCYSYLQKNKRDYISYSDILITPNNIEEKSIFVETVINLIYINGDKEKFKYIHILNKIKKAWQTKSFRDEAKTKHKYHLPITQKAKDNLKKLAAFKNLTEGALLSELIGEAFLKEMCDENGKIIY